MREILAEDIADLPNGSYFIAAWGDGACLYTVRDAHMTTVVAELGDKPGKSYTIDGTGWIDWCQFFIPPADLVDTALMAEALVPGQGHTCIYRAVGYRV